MSKNTNSTFKIHNKCINNDSSCAIFFRYFFSQNDVIKTTTIGNYRYLLPYYDRYYLLPYYDRYYLLPYYDSYYLLPFLRECTKITYQITKTLHLHILHLPLFKLIIQLII